jgi:hypothetical protein
MGDAVLNIPFSSLVNKRKIFINNIGGGLGGHEDDGIAPVEIRGSDFKWTWQGVIKDDRPNASRTNQQWMVCRKFYFNNIVSVLNTGRTAYENNFCQWLAAGGAGGQAGAALNIPYAFAITMDTNLGGSVQTSLPHSAGFSVGQGTQDCRVLGMLPYSIAGGSHEVVVGTFNNSDAANVGPNNCVGGRVHDSWEEGVLVANLYNRQIGFEIMDADTNVLVLRGENAANDVRTTDANVAGAGGFAGRNLPGILLNWVLEFDIYDVLPEKEKGNSRTPHNPPRGNMMNT